MFRSRTGTPFVVGNTSPRATLTGILFTFVGSSSISWWRFLFLTCAVALSSLHAGIRIVSVRETGEEFLLGVVLAQFRFKDHPYLAMTG